MADTRSKTIHKISDSFQLIRKRLFAPSPSTRTLTPAQGFILRFIENRETASIKEIAGIFSITSSAATQLVDILVRKGYAARHAHQKDRRMLEITITKKGREHVRHFKTDNIRQLKQMLRPLSNAELEQYLKINKKIVGAMHPATQNHEN